MINQDLIKNNYNFSNFNNLDFSWYIKGDDRTISSGKLSSLKLEAGESKEIFFNTSNIVVRPGVRYYLMIEAKARNAKPLIPKKHLIAWEQFELPFYQPLAINKDNLAPENTEVRPAIMSPLELDLKTSVLLPVLR